MGSLLAHSAPRFKVDHRPHDPTVSTLDVPGYRQTRGYSCGYAVALMACRYFSSPVKGQQLFEALGTGSQGTSQTALVKTLRKAELKVTVRYELEYRDYCAQLKKGRPVIGYLHDAEHWVLLYGYGKSPKRIFVADPRPQFECENSWRKLAPKLQGFGMICSHQEIPEKAESKQGLLIPDTYMVSKLKTRQRPARKVATTKGEQLQLL